METKAGNGYARENQERAEGNPASQKPLFDFLFLFANMCYARVLFSLEMRSHHPDLSIQHQARIPFCMNHADTV